MKITLIVSLLISFSVKGADAGNAIRIFVPDIGMFIASLTIWLVCRNIIQKAAQEDSGQYNEQFDGEEMVRVHVYPSNNFVFCFLLGPPL